MDEREGCMIAASIKVLGSVMIFPYLDQFAINSIHELSLFIPSTIKFANSFLN